MILSDKSQRPSGRRAGGPSPLEVESAKMTGDVDNFPDEEEAGDLAALHRFRGQFVRVHAAGGDFGFFEALGSGRSNGPCV